MSQKIAVFDIDGTLFRWQLFHELVFELKDQHLLTNDASASLDEAFVKWRGLQASWAEYEQQVVDAIEKYIKTISSSDLEAAARRVVNRSGHKVYAYTAQLAQSLKKQGYYLLAVSGSQQEIAQLFAEKHGFDACIGMVHKRDADGNYTGEYERFIIGRKAAIVKEFVTENLLTLKDSYAVGDSAGDIDMLALVDNPIAFNPSEELLTAAKEHGWSIIIERKNIAYELKEGTNGYVLAETRTF